MDAIVKQLRPQLMDIFHHLHEHPEVSWKEYVTTAFIKRHLEENGCKV